MGQIKIMGALLLSILFGITILGFVANFTSDNNSLVNLDDNFNVYNNQFKNNVTTYYSESGNITEGIYTATITEGDTTTRTGGSFKVGFSGLIGGMNGIFNLVKYQIFDNDPAFTIFLTALSSFIAIIIGLYIWKTWQGGSPD